MNKFLELIAEVMEVDVSKISMDTRYKEIEQWDSLMMLNLILEIEEEYNISIPVEKIGDVKKLQDLYDFIPDVSK